HVRLPGTQPDVAGKYIGHGHTFAGGTYQQGIGASGLHRLQQDFPPSVSACSAFMRLAGMYSWRASVRVFPHPAYQSNGHLITCTGPSPYFHRPVSLYHHSVAYKARKPQFAASHMYFTPFHENSVSGEYD